MIIIITIITATGYIYYVEQHVPEKLVEHH